MQHNRMESEVGRLSKAGAKDLIKALALFSKLQQIAYERGLEGEKFKERMVGIMSDEDMNRTQLVEVASLIDVMISEKYYDGARQRHFLLSRAV